MNFVGADIKDPIADVATPEDCQHICETDLGCRFWTLDVEENRCWLKKGGSSVKADERYTSGTKLCAGSSYFITYFYTWMYIIYKKLFSIRNNNYFRLNHISFPEPQISVYSPVIFFE